MKTDFYTKTILSVIAVCLLLLSREVGKLTERRQNVVIVGWTDASNQFHALANVDSRVPVAPLPVQNR
jgi:hypothetical protein